MANKSPHTSPKSAQAGKAAKASERNKVVTSDKDLFSKEVLDEGMRLLVSAEFADQIGEATRKKVSELVTEAPVEIDLSGLKEACEEYAEMVRKEYSFDSHGDGSCQGLGYGSSIYVGKNRDEYGLPIAATINGQDLVLMRSVHTEECVVLRTDEDLHLTCANSKGGKLHDNGDTLLGHEEVDEYIEFCEALKKQREALPGFSMLIVKNQLQFRAFAELYIGPLRPFSAEKIEKAVREALGAYKNAKITG